MRKLEPAVRTLRLFQVIAEGDGLVQAAGKIGLSQSAASHAIAALERSLGVQLFARNSGQLRLSRIGEQILPHVRQILGSLDAIAEEIVSESGVQTGALRIAVVPSVASSIIPALLREFAKLYPGIDVSLLEGTDHEVAEWVRQKMSHCGFAALPVHLVNSEPIGKDEWMAIVPAKAANDQNQIRLERLASHRFLVSGGGCEDHIYRLFAEARVPLSNHLLVRQMDTLQAMVGEGLGVSLVPSLTLIRKPKQIRAIRLVPRRYRTIGVLLPLDAIPSPALTRWLDLVRARAPVILQQALSGMKRSQEPGWGRGTVKSER
jgi:DNA-binding transcriptional LysR family regulator